MSKCLASFQQQQLQCGGMTQVQGNAVFQSSFSCILKSFLLRMGHYSNLPCTKWGQQWLLGGCWFPKSYRSLHHVCTCCQARIFTLISCKTWALNLLLLLLLLRQILTVQYIISVQCSCLTWLMNRGISEGGKILYLNNWHPSKHFTLCI